MSAAFSESWPEFKLSDKHPRRESSLASLRLIQSKVIRQFGDASPLRANMLCWWWTNTPLNNCSGIQIKGGLISYNLLTKASSLSERLASLLYEFVRWSQRMSESGLFSFIQRRFFTKTWRTKNSLSLECLSSPSLYLLHEFPVISSQQVPVLKKSDEVSQIAVQVDDHELPVSLLLQAISGGWEATGFSSSAETKV